MTSREKSLLAWLGTTIVLVAALLAVGTYLDELTALDAQFLRWQKQAALWQSRTVADQPSPSSAPSGVEAWPSGQLPDPTVLARKFQPVLGRYQVPVLEFRVLTSSATEFRLRYDLEATMPNFHRAYAELRARDPHLRTLRWTATLKDAGVYHISWEVGYATTP